MAFLRYPTGLLIAALSLFTFVWLVYPQQFIASDPWAYSFLAYKISHGLDLGSDNSTFGFRVATYIPVAFFYWLFGVSIYSTNLWPLAAALCIIATVWLALPDTKSKIVGLALCLTSVPLVEESTQLYPDLIATAFMGLAMLLIVRRKASLEHGRPGLLVPVTAVACMLIAFMAKETAYWILPMWVVAYHEDVRDDSARKMFSAFYLPACIAALLLGIAYFGATWKLTGDPFSRIELIQSYTGRHPWSWHHPSTAEVVRRMTIEPARTLVLAYGAIIAVSALALLALPKSLRLWGYYGAICLFLFWFGPTSLTRYQPLPPILRMSLPALPAIYILAAYFISRTTIADERAPGSIAILALMLPALVLFGQTALSWAHNAGSEGAAMARIRHEVATRPQTQYLLVTADTRSSESLAFYFGYRYPANLQVLSAARLRAGGNSPHSGFVFVSPWLSAFLHSVYGSHNYDMQIASAKLPTIFQAKDVTIYAFERPDQFEKLRNAVEQAR